MFARNGIIARSVFALLVAPLVFTACGGGGGGSSSGTKSGSGGGTSIIPVTATAQPSGTVTSAPAGTATSQPAVAGVANRAGFLGAFFRPQGPPAFGVFSLLSPGLSPSPYPAAGTVLAGTSGYCNAVAANGVSIATGNVVDPTKLADAVNLGVRWVRMPAPQFTDDDSHIFGAGQYNFGDFDSAQCSTLVAHGIKPVVGLEAGPVQYDAVPGTFSPQQVTTYKTAGDFGSWCGAVAAHERAVFPSVTQFSLPGNEVNTNPSLFPGGNAQIAAFSEACYSAIKTANPNAFVYGFELNMDGNLNTPGFVRAMAALGCRVGTCYDGLAIHLSLRYPIPSSTTPCYPNTGGDYSMQCVTDIQTAAQAPIHILISESVFTIPGSVPDEATKALAIVAEFKAFATNTSIDGASYANVDECALYPSGYFSGGCIISTSGQIFPGYTALQQLAIPAFQ
jgi:hypothetical protein